MPFNEGTPVFCQNRYRDVKELCGIKRVKTNHQIPDNVLFSQDVNRLKLHLRLPGSLLQAEGPVIQYARQAYSCYIKWTGHSAQLSAIDVFHIVIKKQGP